MRFNMVLCGLGGQGIIFAGKLFSAMALKKGWPVIGAETHGMAQRGGSVVAHLRFGDQEGSLVPSGQADALLAFKESEAYRSLNLLKPGGDLFINAPEFPGNGVHDYVEKNAINGFCLDADRLAVEEGVPRAVNLILASFACASGRLPFDLAALEATVREVTPERFLAANLKAMEVGVKG